MKWHKDAYLISDNPEDLDYDVIHRFLSQSYWAEKIPRNIVEELCKNSLCFGIYLDGGQVGFGRLITDYATFAFVSDVFVLEEHRNRGLADWMLVCMKEHPRMQGLRRWMLATKDAHALYSKHGFVPMKNPDWFMEKAKPDIYKRQ